MGIFSPLLILMLLQISKTQESVSLQDLFCVMLASQYLKTGENQLLTKIAWASDQSANFSLAASKVLAQTLIACRNNLFHTSERDLVLKVKDLVSADPIINPEDYLNPQYIDKITAKTPNNFTEDEKSVLQTAKFIRALSKVFQ